MRVEDDPHRHPYGEHTTTAEPTPADDVPAPRQPVEDARSADPAVSSAVEDVDGGEFPPHGGNEAPGPVRTEDREPEYPTDAAPTDAARTDEARADEMRAEGVRADDTATDDEAALADVDRGEFPPDGHAVTEEDAWLKSEDEPAGEMTIGEPAVGVASVPPPGEALSPAEAGAPTAEPGVLTEPETRPTEPGTRPTEPGVLTEPGTPPAEPGTRPAEPATAESPEAEAPAAEAQTAEPSRDAAIMAAAATGAGPEPEPERETEPETRAETVEPGADVEPGAADVEPGADVPGADVAGADVEPGGADVESEELAPGEVPVAVGVVLWETEVVDGFKDRWQQIQLRFIDDPRRAAEQAQVLVGDVCRELTDGLSRQRGDLDRWQGAQLEDTEELRVTVRRYRDLLDRLFGI
ncbi:MAG: hypothetical protein AUI14_15475 [Actinobacteria bacterium 13_2_20CM_2_71_6]|nr:MAG: hypothetical protein AUI14_15475 [Actinobacteria bacterium 13_2_20CM_2_71_6]